MVTISPQSYRSSLAVLFLLLAASANLSLAADPCLSAANLLAENQQNDLAVTEYKRYLFFHPDSPVVAIENALADCYKNIGQFSEAVQTLDNILARPLNDTLRDATKIKRAVLQLACNNKQGSLLELARIASFSPVPALRGKAEFLMCCVYLQEGNFQEIHAMALSETADCRIRLIDSVASLYGPIFHKSVATALWMSSVMPGLGQIYAHDIKNGVNALALSMLTGYLTINSITGGFYGEAMLTDITLFLRYYNGNRWGAKNAAETYNAAQNRRIRKKIMDALAAAGPDCRD